MRRQSLSLALTAVGLVLAAAGAAGAEAGFDGQGSQPTPLPQDVTGERLYRLYCISCHGDQMRGLTAEWIAQWPATHQNCWVPKCHGLNHPPDGFTIPTEAPAIAGSGALLKFRTAYDLHAYVRATMPYQEPAWLTDEEYWDIVAYVLARHGILDLPRPLTAENAREVEITAGVPSVDETSPGGAPEGHEGPPEETPRGLSTPAIALLIGAGGIGAAAIVAARRRRPRRS